MFTWRDKTLAYCSKYLTPGIKFCGRISLQNIFHQAQLLKQIKGNIYLSHHYNTQIKQLATTNIQISYFGHYPKKYLLGHRFMAHGPKIWV